MNYADFTKAAFESCEDQQARRRLSDELQEAVADELHRATLPAFQKIIRRLNAEGHSLLLSEASMGDIAYRDEPVENTCWLRLACDVVISAGYADLQSNSQSVDEIIAEVTSSLRAALTSPPQPRDSSDK